MFWVFYTCFPFSLYIISVASFGSCRKKYLIKRTTITITHRFILPFVIDNFYRPNEAWAPNISETLVPEMIWLEKESVKQIVLLVHQFLKTQLNTSPNHLGTAHQLLIGNNLEVIRNRIYTKESRSPTSRTVRPMAQATGFPPNVEKYPPSLSDTSLGSKNKIQVLETSCLPWAYHSTHGIAVGHWPTDCDDVGDHSKTLEAPHVLSSSSQTRPTLRQDF